MKWIAAAALGLAVTGLAALGWAAVTDLDEDGLISLAEAQAVYPSLTPETFTTLDGDGDGFLTLDEVAAAEEAGVLAPEG